MPITKRLMIATLLLCCALPSQSCNDESLSIQIPKLTITPQPTALQSELADPVGLALGEIPFFGFSTATFELANSAVGTLKISSTTIKSSSGGNFEILAAPTVLKSQQRDDLIIEFSPDQDETEAVAVIELQTNAGADLNNVYEVQVRGSGLFIGEPSLRIVYGGLSYPLESHCEATDDDVTECTLDPLDFGFIPIGEAATQPLRLRNVPADGTCMLPNLPSGEPNCTPACVITFKADPNGANLGLGFVPEEAGFSLAGATPTPFKLAPANPNCPSADETLNLLRGDLPLLLNFAGAAEEGDHSGAMILESNAPDSERVEIPLRAKVRKAPIAVATLRECTGDNLTECSEADSLEPLMRVFLDGSQSYDPAGGEVVAYHWEVLESPPGTDVNMFQETGSATALYSFWMPLTGPYKIKLTVINDLGVPSAETETSIVTVTALPDSRLHIQLVWDSPVVDLDLHLVYADQDPSHKEAYHKDWDCYWLSCRPNCETQTPSPCTSPLQWFNTHEAFEGPNPRLDIDDTNGFGPENINITFPAPGKYHIYVHYYAIGTGGDLERTRATIRVYGDGLLQGEFQRALSKNHLWAVSEVEWNADGTSTVVPAQADGEGLSGSVVELPYLPPNGEGFYFGNVFP